MGIDGVMVEVSLDVVGCLVVCSNCVDMGNGFVIMLVFSMVGWLGYNVYDIVMGDVGSFNVLVLNYMFGGSYVDL